MFSFLDIDRMYWRVSKLTFDHCAHCRKSFSTYSLCAGTCQLQWKCWYLCVCSESCLFFFFEAKGFVCFWYVCLLSTFCMHMLSWLLLDLTLDLRSDFPSCLFKGWLGVYPMVLLFLLPVDNLFSWPLTVIDQVACLFTILFIPNSTQGSFSQTCLE